MHDAAFLIPPSKTDAAQTPSSVSSLWSKAWKALQEGLRHEQAAAIVEQTTALVVVKNRRVWIAKRRCHHGLVGIVVTTTGLALKQPELVLIGALLMWDDKEDWPWPMNRL